MTTDSAWHICDIRLGADHPAAAGHFPGHPIIPGAVLLDHAVSALGATGRAGEIRAVKFLAPVRPGDRLQLRWKTGRGGLITFEGLNAMGERVLTGQLVAQDAAP